MLICTSQGRLGFAVITNNPKTLVAYKNKDFQRAIVALLCLYSRTQVDRSASVWNIAGCIE